MDESEEVTAERQLVKFALDLAISLLTQISEVDARIDPGVTPSSHMMRDTESSQMRDLSSNIISCDSQSTPQQLYSTLSCNNVSNERGSIVLQKRRRKTNLKDKQKIRRQTRF